MFVGDSGAVTNWGGSLAISILSTLSTIFPLTLFFAQQKYFV